MRTELTVEALRELEEARRAAMIAVDIDALDRLTSPSFVYQHGTGARQDKAAFLRLVAQGSYCYEAISSSNEWTFIRGQVAVMVTTLHLTVITNGKKFVATRRGTLVWALNDGRWQVEAYQGTIPADEEERAREADNEPEEVKHAMALAAGNKD